MAGRISSLPPPFKNPSYVPDCLPAHNSQSASTNTPSIKLFSSLQPTSLHKRLPQGSAFSSFSQQFSLASSNEDYTSPNSPLKAPAMCPEDWELHPSQVLVETRLGHGTFGDVFKGMVRGGVGLYKSKGPLNLNGVAIKLLKSKIFFVDGHERTVDLYSSLFG